jgi:hypothetical protein
VTPNRPLTVKGPNGSVHLPAGRPADPARLPKGWPPQWLVDAGWVSVTEVPAPTKKTDTPRPAAGQEQE